MECRLCNSPLPDTDQCSTCGYITVSDPAQEPDKVDLAGILPFVPEHFRDVEVGLHDRTKAETVLLSLLVAGFEALIDRCRQDRPRAGGLFLALLAGLDEEIQTRWHADGIKSTSGIKSVVTANTPSLQALYFALEVAGGIDPQASVASMMALPTSWSAQVRKIASYVGGLSFRLRKLRRGTERIGFSKGMLIAEQDSNVANLWKEQDLNRDHFETALPPLSLGPDMLAPKDASQALRSEMGFGFDDVMEFLLSRTALWNSAISELGPLRVVSIDRLLGAQKSLSSTLILDLNTATRLGEPFWFRLAPRRRESSESVTSLLADACSQNWINTFPLFRAASANDESIAVFSPQLLYGNLSLLENAKGRILDRLTRRSPKYGPFQQRTHQVLEQRAAAIAKEQGWRALQGIKEVSGGLLTCGEIDLVCGYSDTARSIVVVGEVKDFDLSVELDMDLLAHREGIKRASEQLERKTVWIDTHRALIGSLLKVSEDFDLKAWVISTRYIAPPLAGHYPHIPIGALGRQFDLCKRGADRYWWKPPG